MGELPAELRARRESEGLLLKEVASRAGISTSYLSLIERGDRNPPLSTLERIADALDTRVTLVRIRIR